MSVRPKILALACKITIESKTGVGVLPTDPEYRILDPVVTDDMADVAMALKVRKHLQATEIAKKCGRPLEETEKLLWDLAIVGVVTFEKNKQGIDEYWLPIWVPGIMEMMVGNKENVEKYPVIAECFEEYTRRRTAILAPNLPNGKGMMRVIPVQSAIDGETRAASYEEVREYIENARLISVADCSCRRSRRLMGEGCGHLEKDMCMPLNEGAEFYIRTGRAREISKEEAYEILQKAEDNGLVHEITNIDGDGNAHAICNCCGCSCFSLRIAEMFRTPNMCRSNYVSHVDAEKCVACGQCVENCQMNAIKLGQKLCSSEHLQPVKDYDKPYDTIWGKDKRNMDFRTNRKDVVDSGTAPCKTDCPAHIAVQGYIKLAAQGKYGEALELIKKENPFPAVCGRICSRLCEQECTRGDIDDPIAIDEIKRFIAEQDLNEKNRFVPKILNQTGEPFANKIAVIGAGPAGMTCAYFLAVKGYPVTVFEKQEKLGGMLTLGIPSFRLEKDVVEAEIDILKELGVEFKTGIEIGKDLTITDLRKQGYEAFYLAIGAQNGRKVGVSGEDAQGVISGVEFLRNVNLGKDAKLKGKTIVVGGGNVAIDVARVAIREGSNTVNMYCLESRDTMPALDEEIEEAEGEGVVINNSWGPKEILVKDGKVTGVVFKKCISVFDASHKFSPKYDENDTITVEADNVLLSIGQSFDYGEILKGTKVELNPNKTVKSDSFTYQTDESDIFVGGDVYSGPKFAIDAIAAGKQGAESIHRFVHPGQSLVIGRDRREYHALDKSKALISIEGYDNTPRQRTEQVDTSKSKNTFKDLRLTFTEEQVKKETERCLGCGAAVVDEYMCIGCGICTTKCNFDAVSLHKIDDAPGQPVEKLLNTLVPSMLKRGGKIAVKKVKETISKD